MAEEKSGRSGSSALPSLVAMLRCGSFVLMIDVEGGELSSCLPKSRGGKQTHGLLDGQWTMDKMRILITGNMGYIGPNVVGQLRQSRTEAELIGYDTAYFASALTSIEPLPERELKAQY